jgi:hypothetical protein
MYKDVEKSKVLKDKRIKNTEKLNSTQQKHKTTSTTTTDREKTLRNKK